MEQILLAHGLPKETVTAIMMLYKNMKVKVRLLDGDTDFYDIAAAGVLQRDTLAPYMLIIFLDYVLQTLIDLMKENRFALKKVWSRQYPAQIIIATDYADDIGLLANTPTQAESLLYNLEQAAGGVGLHEKADKMEYVF